MGTTRRSALISCMGALLASFAVRVEASMGSEELSKEYRVKAAYIYNFAGFATWPEEAFETEESPIVVGLVGRDPFGGALDASLKGRKIGKRALRVERFEKPSQLRFCHLLFIARGDEEVLLEALKFTRGKSVLSVSEVPGALDRGALVNFFIEDKSVRFEVQVDEVKRSKLALSSKLLRLAKIVRDEETEGGGDG